MSDSAKSITLNGRGFISDDSHVSKHSNGGKSSSQSQSSESTIMDSIMESQLSESEFKARLYSTFQKKGIMESLQSQLRCLMVKELQPPPSESLQDQEQYGGLMMKVANDVIISHLNKNGYEFTLSTFIPEARIRPNESLSCRDLTHFLHLQENHPIAESLESSEKGFLLPLLDSVSNYHSPIPVPDTVSVSVQTQSDEMLEGSEGGVALLEGRMLTFRREVENRNKKLMEAEIRRFKEKECALIRMEERNKHMKEVSEVKEKLEAQYKQKMAQNKRNIENEKERLKRREIELEEGLFTQRQLLLEEMEMVKMRENELKRQTEINKRLTTLEQEKVHSLQEVLKGKDELLEDIKRQYEGMAEARVDRCAAEWQTKRIQEEQKRKKVEVELHGLISGKADLIAQCDDLKNLLAKERQSSNSLNKELSVAAERQNELLKCIKTLENKVQQQKKVIDDSLIPISKLRTGKERQTDGEIEKLQITVSELECTIGKMNQQQTSNDTKEKQSLEQLVMKINQEKMALKYDNRQLHKEVTEKTNACIHLQQIYDQQAVILQSAYREIDDLQEQVGQLQQLLLDSNNTTGKGAIRHNSPRKEKNKNKKMKKVSPAKRPSLDLSSSSTCNSSPLPPRTTRAPPLSSSFTTVSPAVTQSFSDSSAVLIAEARATFVRLENEAMNLERNYSIYRPLVVTAAISQPSCCVSTALFPSSLPVSAVPDVNNVVVLSPVAATPPSAAATPPSVITPMSPDTSTLTTTSFIEPAPVTTTSLNPLPLTQYNTASVSNAPLITTVSSMSTGPLPMMTTPTQYTATPIFTVTDSRPSTSLKKSISTSELVESTHGHNTILDSVPPPPQKHVVSLDALWKKDTEHAQEQLVSHEGHMTVPVSHVMSSNHVPTEYSQIVYLPPSHVTSQQTIDTNESMGDDNDGEYEKWQKQREEKNRLREEIEKLERERETRELLKIEQQTSKKQEAGSFEMGNISQKEEVSDGKEKHAIRNKENTQTNDMLKYMELVQVPSTSHAHIPEDIAKKSPSLSLETKSLTFDDRTSQSKDNDDSDTFENW